jgi:small subunit ribosomal protein S17e
MGRIRTGFVKRAAEKLIKAHKDRFTDKFEDNKIKVREVADIPTKKLRNLIAGYITKKVKMGLD